MHAAPPVSVRCTGAWPWWLLNLGLPALAAAALATWVLQHLEWPVWPALLAATAAAGLAMTRPHEAAGLLQWDGQRWTADGRPGRLQLMVDLGGALLLRLHLDGGGARWLPVTAAEAGPAWHALRAAVYSRPPETTTTRGPAPERASD